MEEAKMNKQELIKHIRALPYSKGPLKDTAEVNIGWLIRNIDQLDEQEKAKVPQFVADWIKHSRNTGCSLFGAMSIFEENIEIKKWMQWSENQELFARAWLDGYEVEEEKKYFVKLKAVDQYLVSVKDEDFLGFLQSRLRSKFTRKELEDANLGWVFDCPGIEIEEVE
jgi:hypothetical protein